MGEGVREVRVRLGGEAGDRAYSVVVGNGVLSEAGRRAREIVCGTQRPGRAFLVVDDGLPALTIEMGASALRAAGFRVEMASVHATEQAPGKSLGTVERLVTHMAAARLERREPVVALGGGIVGDVAAFAAGVYRRGVPVMQCPTTLLSMVDASVGGKTGVNLAVPGVGGVVELKKNMVGVFHQPSLVVCDVAVLDSLADDELASGVAECVKHALLGADWGDAGLMAWTTSHAREILAKNTAELAELVGRNVAIKAHVVEGDEREERLDGLGRMSLNMGHTLGHALETMDVRGVVGGRARSEPGLKHGEAVAVGLVGEAAIGEALGVSRGGLADELERTLSDFGLPTRVSGVEALGGVEAVVGAMMDDKKVGGGKLRVAVPTGGQGGHGCAIVESPARGAVEGGVRRVLHGT